MVFCRVSYLISHESRRRRDAYATTRGRSKMGSREDEEEEEEGEDASAPAVAPTAS